MDGLTTNTIEGEQFQKTKEKVSPDLCRRLFIKRTFAGWK